MRNNKMVMKPCQEPSRYCVLSRDMNVQIPWSAFLFISGAIALAYAVNTVVYCYLYRVILKCVKKIARLQQSSHKRRMHSSLNVFSQLSVKRRP